MQHKISELYIKQHYVTTSLVFDAAMLVLFIMT
jgi:hypothetical protein